MATVSLGAGVGPAIIIPGRARAQQKTLKILQWHHFIPEFDRWFNDTYVKEWGEKNNTRVIVDNVGMTSLHSRAAAEIAAQKGHDIFFFLSPPAIYEDHVIDHREIHEECEKKYGPPWRSPEKAALILKRRNIKDSRTVMCRIRSTTVKTCGMISVCSRTLGRTSGWAAEK
jgi:hypothetical protein